MKGRDEVLEGYKKKFGKEELRKPIEEAIRLLEDEIPFTSEEVVKNLKEALK